MSKKALIFRLEFEVKSLLNTAKLGETPKRWGIWSTSRQKRRRKDTEGSRERERERMGQKGDGLRVGSATREKRIL